MKVAVFWNRLNGYINACLQELASRPNVELLVAYETAKEDAPFDEDQFSWMPARVAYTDRPDREELLARAQAFAPDVLLVASWHIGEYRYVLGALRPRPLRVLCMDNQWHRTLKQLMGVAGAPWYIHRLYDAVFLPGERQACFARRLGFPDDRIWHGLYCQGLANVPSTTPAPPAKRFGYLGRLSAEKGIQDLLDGYEIYRDATPDPWDLVVAGEGALRAELDRHPSVRYTGFVQPKDVASWFDGIGCLVVPSRFEPWGVVISEAAARGIPIIATEACGAVPHLVHDFCNGRVAHTADARSLAASMAFIAGTTDAERAAMGHVSRALSSPYTPARWADTVLGRSSELIHTRSR